MQRCLVKLNKSIFHFYFLLNVLTKKTFGFTFQVRSSRLRGRGPTAQKRPLLSMPTTDHRPTPSAAAPDTDLSMQHRHPTGGDNRQERHMKKLLTLGLFFPYFPTTQMCAFTPKMLYNPLSQQPYWPETAGKHGLKH